MPRAYQPYRASAKTYQLDLPRIRAFLLQGYCIMSSRNAKRQKDLELLLRTLKTWDGHRVMARRVLRTQQMYIHQGSAYDYHYFIDGGGIDLRCKACRPEWMMMQRLRGDNLFLEEFR